MTNNSVKALKEDRS